MSELAEIWVARGSKKLFKIMVREDSYPAKYAIFPALVDGKIETIEMDFVRIHEQLSTFEWKSTVALSAKGKSKRQLDLIRKHRGC